MAPLIVLLTSFMLMLLVNKFLLKNRFNNLELGRAAMSVMLLMTGIAHFTRTEAMAEMLPDFVQFKTALIFFTGIVEIATAIGLLFKKSARLSSILLIVFFICVLPANIIGSIKQVQLGGMEAGRSYLYFRIPLQIFFIWWVYYFGIRSKK